MLTTKDIKDRYFSINSQNYYMLQANTDRYNVYNILKNIGFPHALELSYFCVYYNYKLLC